MINSCRYIATKSDSEIALGGIPILQELDENRRISTNQVAERFGCTAMTLEMPYKDNVDAPDPVQGWSPERCKQLGRDCLSALLEWLDDRQLA